MKVQFGTVGLFDLLKRNIRSEHKIVTKRNLDIKAITKEVRKSGDIKKSFSNKASLPDVHETEYLRNANDRFVEQALLFFSLLVVFLNDVRNHYVMSAGSGLHWACNIRPWFWSVWWLFCFAHCYHHKWYRWSWEATASFGRIVWSYLSSFDIRTTASRYVRLTFLPRFTQRPNACRVTRDACCSFCERSCCSTWSAGSTRDRENPGD